MYRELKKPLPAICAECGHDYKKNNWNQKLCDKCRILKKQSSSKRDAVKKKIIARKKRNMKICKHCFRTFRLTRGDRDYCDRVCYRRANRIKFLHKRMKEIEETILNLTGRGKRD